MSSVKYRVVLEYDPESGHHVATVPGLPGLFVDAKTEADALKLAKEGILFYMEEVEKSHRGRRGVRPVPAKVVTVDV
jgi:predicted RNase H-like HicB family nuclease